MNSGGRRRTRYRYDEQPNRVKIERVQLDGSSQEARERTNRALTDFLLGHGTRDALVNNAFQLGAKSRGLSARPAGSSKLHAYQCARRNS